MTSAQPYQGRHSAPDADADDAPRSPAEPALAAAASQAGSVSRPSLPPHLAAVLSHQDQGQRSAGADMDSDDWMAYAPPHELAPKRTVWEVPAGFKPMKPPRTRSYVRSVGWIVVVAVLASLGWFGYRVFTQPKAKLHTLATPAPTVTYTSAAGHFIVGLPAEPQTSTYSQTLGGYHMDAAVVAVPGAREGVIGFVVTPSIPADHMGEFMQGGIDGFARDNRLSRITKTTYHGRPAITAAGTTAHNEPIQVLLYAYSSAHMYLLLAPDQAALRTLEGHFHPTR